MKRDINVTPLVDVVLVLLIVFMVVTPLLERGKLVALPRAGTASELGGGADPVVVSITRDGRTWIGDGEVAPGALRAEIARRTAERPGARILLKGDRDLEYRAVRAIFVELARARVAGVSLAAAPAAAPQAR